MSIFFMFPVDRRMVKYSRFFFLHILFLLVRIVLFSMSTWPRTCVRAHCIKTARERERERERGREGGEESRKKESKRKKIRTHTHTHSLSSSPSFGYSTTYAEVGRRTRERERDKEKKIYREKIFVRSELFVASNNNNNNCSAHKTMLICGVRKTINRY